MGWIRRLERELTDAERDAVDRPKNDPFWRELHGIAPSDLLRTRVIEYDIGIDRVTKPSTAVTLSPATELYLLEVGPTLIIGFEMCFMNHTAVSGAFASDRVSVGFAVPGGVSEGGNSFYDSRWPVGFRWQGNAVEIIDVAEPSDWDQIVPIYRLSAIQEAYARQNTDAWAHES